MQNWKQSLFEEKYAFEEKLLERLSMMFTTNGKMKIFFLPKHEETWFT